jgi:hypothetical protein
MHKDTGVQPDNGIKVYIGGKEVGKGVTQISSARAPKEVYELGSLGPEPFHPNEQTNRKEDTHMDLNVIINNALIELKEERFLENTVKTHLKKTLESVVSDALRSYSTFGKKLSAEVESLLDINLKELDLPSYNQLILTTIKEHIDAMIKDEGLNHMKEQLDSLLVHTKDEYLLSEIMKMLVEEIPDLSDIGYDEYHEMTLIVDTDFSLTTYIYFDAESKKSQYDCKYALQVSTKTNQVVGVKVRNSRYDLDKGNKEFDSRTIMSGLHGLEQLFFKMYSRKVKVIIDEDDCELEISNPEYD